VGVSVRVEGAQKQEELRRIEADIKTNEQNKAAFRAKAENLKKEAAALRAQLIALSQSVQQREANVTRLEKALTEITLEEKQARQALEERHGQSVETLMALQRMALNPPEAIIALPQPPADMVRSAILLRSIVPQIQKQAEELRRQMEAYAQKRQKLEKQKTQLGYANRDLEDERRRLNILIDEKKALSVKYLSDSRIAEKRIESLSRKAKTLQSLLKEIEREKERQARIKAQEPPRKPVTNPEKAQAEDNDLEIVLGKPPSGKPIAKSKGNLARPASGPIIMRYGQKEKLGGKHKGISIKTRPNAQVVATYDGQIAFAGPFRGYKQLLIIDHGAGYHTLLTGMDRINVSVGQWLLSGEPVGVMSGDRSNDDPLYFELRKKGAPINPLPWIRQRNAKAQG
jgi:septal ring factor EnvC (AmiA/AmiB activator)